MTSEKAEKAQPQRSRLVRLLTSVLVVIALAGTLFNWHRAERAKEIDELYARRVAHLGRQAELKFKAYENIADSLTPVTKDAGEAARALVQLLYQKNAQTEVKQSHRLAQEELERSQQALKDATRELDEAERHKREALRKRQQADGDSIKEYNEAIAARTVAEARAKEAKEAAQAAESAASRSGKAAAEASEKALEAGKAEQELQTLKGASTKPESTSTSSAPEGGQPGPYPKLDPDLEVARTRAEATKRAATEAVQAAHNARQIADGARDKAAAASEEARLAGEVAGRLWVRFLEAAKQKDAAEGAAKDAAERAQNKKAASDARHASVIRSTDAVQRAHAALEAELELLKKADDQAKTLEGNFLNGALPSYHTDLLKCLGLQSGEARGQCLTRAVASMSNPSQHGLQFIQCPDYATGVSAKAYLGPGRRSLIFPLRNDRDVSVGCGRLPLEQVFRVAPSLLPSQDGQTGPGRFAEVVLLSSDGMVLRTSAESSLRLSKLPGFNPKSATASHVLREVEVGTRKYRIYLQPIFADVAMPCQAGATCEVATSEKSASASVPALLVAGLVDEDKFVIESVKVAPTWYLWFFVLVGFAVLSLPLAKLWFLGPGAPYTKYDAGLLGSAGAIATLLFVIVSLAVFSHDRLDRRNDQRLEAVGAEILDLMRARLTTAAEALAKFSEQTQDLQAALAEQDEIASETVPSDTVRIRRKISEECSKHVEKTEKGGGIALWDGFEQADRTLSVCEVVGYALPSKSSHDLAARWNQAVWINRDGFQLAKFTGGAHATTPVSVAHRSYFRRAIEQRAGCFAGSEPTRGDLPKDCASVEVVRSATTGSMLLMVARPSGSNSDSAAPQGVVALSVKLTEMDDVVLPRDVQVAVVDAEGNVMLHSDIEGQHGHNLFDDIDDAGVLRSALERRNKARIDARYLGVSSRLAIEYLPGADWFVVTVAPRTVIDLPTSSMLIVTTIGCGLFGLLTIFILGIGYLGTFWLHAERAAQQHRVVVRPDARLIQGYTGVGLVGLIFAVSVGLLGALAPALNWRFLPPSLLLASQLGAVATIFWLLRSPEEDSASGGRWKRRALRVRRTLATAIENTVTSRVPWRHNLGVNYTIWCFSLIGLFVVVPATVLFFGAYDHVTENMVRMEQQHYVRSVTRTHCLTNPDLAECPLVIRGKSFASMQTTGLDDSLTLGQTAQSSMLSKAVKCAHQPVSCLAEAYATLDSTSFVGKAISYAGRDGLLSGWMWTRTPRTVVLAPSGEALRLESQLPGLFDLEGRRWQFFLLVAGLVAFSVAAFVLAWRSSERLHFLKTVQRWNEEVGVSANAAIEMAQHGCVLVLHASETLLAETASHPSANELRAGSASVPPDGTLVVSNLIGFLREDGAIPLLQQALDTGRHVLAFSDVDPLVVATSDEVGLWTKSLNSFAVLLAPARIDPKLNGQSQPSPLYLAHIWNESSDEERHVLAAMAVGEFAPPHPETARTLNKLAARGLLHPQTLTLANPSLAQFIRNRVPSSDLKRASLHDTSSTWDAIKAPLVTAVLSLAAALGVSEPSLAATGMVVPTVAAGLPAVLRMLATIAGLAPK